MLIRFVMNSTRLFVPCLAAVLGWGMASGQQAPNGLPGCTHVVLSDGTTQVELSAHEAVLTERGAGLTLAVLDSAKLRQAAALRRPTIRFCVRGVPLVAYGNPVMSSAIPKGAEAFYPLSPDNTILFDKGRVRMLLVNKLFSK